jgi:hypothetical protein
MTTVIPTNVVRASTFRRCAACGHQRSGNAAPGWPREAAICPRCSQIGRIVLALGEEHLSPPSL